MRNKASLVSVASCALAILAATSAAAPPQEPLDIYVVRGSSKELARFHDEIGKEWRGGKLLERLSSKAEYRYWAYSSRTAAQARTFMFGSMNSGLRLDFEQYEQTTYYPAERALLDKIVSTCRLQSDPFFIEPDRTLVVTPVADPAGNDCTKSELRKLKPGDMPVRFDSTQSERG